MDSKPIDGLQVAEVSEAVRATDKPADKVADEDTIIEVPAAGESKEKEDDKAKKEKASLRNFFRVLSFAKGLDWVLICAGFIAAIGAGVALPLMNIVFGNLVGAFNGYFIPGAGVSKDAFLATVNQNALYIVYLFIGKFVLAYISMFSFRMISVRVSATLRLAYFDAVLAQPISALDKYPPGEATNAITTSTNIIQIGISDKLSLFVQSIALVVASYVIAFKYSWALTLVSSSTMVFILIAFSLIVPPFVSRLRKLEKIEEDASSISSEIFSSIRTVMALGAQDELRSRYSALLVEWRKLGRTMSFLVGAQFSPAFFAIYCDYALTFWFGLKLYNEGTIPNINTVIIVFFSILIIVTALGNIANPVVGISKAASAATGILAMIDKPRRTSSGKRDPEVSANEDITFQDVTFAYPGRPNVAVLKNLNVHFAKGKTTAIVGPSGSGKSTIVALLERWYQLSDSNTALDEKLDVKGKDGDSPATEKSTEQTIISNSGIVSIGTYDLVTTDMKWWRSQIGLVSQEPFLFNDTIFNNVAYGLVGSRWESVDDAQKQSLIEDACAESFADEFIRRLPMGYQTKVGEGGIKLSGGQRQRIAIARSIIKKPPILILDEATSSIDVRGEHVVQAALDRVAKNRTTITIAHRLSTVKKADNIIVLRDGKAVEEGTHQSLLADSEGVYYKLVHAQNLETSAVKDEEVEDQDSFETTEEAIERKHSELAKASGILDEKDEPYKPRGILRTIWLFIRESRSSQLWYGVILISTMACGAMFALQSWIFAKLIQVFQYTGQQLIDTGNFWSLIFFILAIGAGIFYFALGWACNVIGLNVGGTYRLEYFDSMLAKPIAFFDAEENSSGTLASRLSSDPRSLQELMGVSTGFPLISFFNVLGCVAISFAFGWKLALVAVFSATPFIFFAAFMRTRFEVQYDKMNNKVFAESSQFASEAMGAFRTVTALTLESTIQTRYKGLLDEHIRKAFRKARYATLIFAASDSVELLCMALTFWYGGQLLANREYDVVQFFVVYVAIVQGGQAAGMFLGIAANIAFATAAGNRILSLRSKPNSTENGGPAGVKPASDAGEGARIELKDVSFKYPTRDTPVFEHLNLTIEKGQFVAFVGPSGCGKTTVVSLLERFYDIQSGAILVDGVNIRTLPPAVYRTSLALVSQEPTLFAGTVRSNLTLGLPDATSVADAELERACRDAEIHAFLASLPDSYATKLGGKAQATALSGGQKQRLCVARALLRRPRVLLLDEATSSLDSQSERLVQAAVERVAAGRRVTVVAVAHRLATVQRADVIFVFGEGGKVAERGSHAELVRKRGVYWGMCQAQALDR